jgi:hypothetical protein
MLGEYLEMRHDSAFPVMFICICIFNPEWLYLIRLMIHCRFAAGARNFSCLHNIQTCSGAHPDYTVDVMGSSWGKTARA